MRLGTSLKTHTPVHNTMSPRRESLQAPLPSDTTRLILTPAQSSPDSDYARVITLTPRCRVGFKYERTFLLSFSHRRLCGYSVKISCKICVSFSQSAYNLCSQALVNGRSKGNSLNMLKRTSSREQHKPLYA